MSLHCRDVLNVTMVACPIVRQDLGQWMVLVCPTPTSSSMCPPPIALLLLLQLSRLLVLVNWKVN